MKLGELRTDDPPFEPREELRKDTVAAKRIWSACRKSQYHRRLIVELDQDCNCTEFLMSPFHDCKDGKHHMCNDCHENALVLLRQPNSRIVATGGDSQVQSQVVSHDEIFKIIQLQANGFTGVLLLLWRFWERGTAGSMQDLPPLLSLPLLR